MNEEEILKQLWVKCQHMADADLVVIMKPLFVLRMSMTKTIVKTFHEGTHFSCDGCCYSCISYLKFKFNIISRVTGISNNLTLARAKSSEQQGRIASNEFYNHDRDTKANLKSKHTPISEGRVSMIGTFVRVYIYK